MVIYLYSSFFQNKNVLMYYFIKIIKQRGSRGNGNHLKKFGGLRESGYGLSRKFCFLGKMVLLGGGEWRWEGSRREQAGVQVREWIYAVIRCRPASGLTRVVVHQVWWEGSGVGGDSLSRSSYF